MGWVETLEDTAIPDQSKEVVELLGRVTDDTLEHVGGISWQNLVPQN
jgi:hypothetical protein